MSKPTWLTVTRWPTYPKWELVEYEAYEPGVDECNNMSTNAYFKALDENGLMLTGPVLLWSWPDGAQQFTLGKEPAGFCYKDGQEIRWGVAIQMGHGAVFFPDRGEAGPHKAQIFAGQSDVLVGMGLPYAHHWQFTGVWQWKLGTTTPPPVDPPPAETETEFVIIRQVVKPNGMRRIVLEEVKK